MNKKYWIIIVSIVVAAVFLYFLLKEPKQIDSHDDDYTRIVAERDTFKVREAVGLKKIDSLETVAKKKDSITDRLKNEQVTTRKALDNKTTLADRYAREVKELRNGDTSEFARKCDSLAEQAINFKFLYDQYKAYSDSITAVMDSQNLDYIKALEERRKLYDELKQKYDHVFDGYATLYEDLKSANKRIKRERLKTKIAAILGLAAGAAAVLK